MFHSVPARQRKWKQATWVAWLAWRETCNIWEAPGNPRQYPGSPRQYPGSPRQYPGSSRQYPGSHRQNPGSPRQYSVFVVVHGDSIVRWRMSRVLSPWLAVYFDSLDDDAIWKLYVPLGGSISTIWYIMSLPTKYIMISTNWICRSMTIADSTLTGEIFTKHAYTYRLYECYLIGELLFLCGSVAEGLRCRT